jgi:Acetyl-coenzyme A synthetase N-terminus
MIMKSPKETEARVSHFRFSSAKIRARMHAQTSQSASGDFTWAPTPEQLAAANVGRLANALDCSSYDQLHRVSIEEPDRFWRAVVDDLGIPLREEWDKVLDDSRGIEWAT